MEIIIFFASWPTIYLLFALLFDLSRKQPFKTIQISTMKEIAFVLDNFSLQCLQLPRVKTSELLLLQGALRFFQRCEFSLNKKENEEIFSQWNPLIVLVGNSLFFVFSTLPKAHFVQFNQLKWISRSGRGWCGRQSLDDNYCYG